MDRHLQRDISFGQHKKLRFEQVKIKMSRDKNGCFDFDQGSFFPDSAKEVVKSANIQGEQIKNLEKH